MSLLLPFAFAAATAAPSLPHCSWDRPGHRAFMGDVVAAVDRYADIPSEVRQRLKRRMSERRYDDIATIGRDSIAGRFDYSGELRDMHFANGEVCARVTRSNWPAGASERGLVYCDSGHCIIVPTVCRNVARVTRLDERVAAAGATAGDDVLARLRTTPASPAATPPPAPEPRDAGPPGAAPSITLPPSAPFEQLAPHLARPGPGLSAPPASDPATAAAGSGATTPGSPTVPALISAPNPVLPQVLMPGTEASERSLGDLGAVLPVLAWTTPFGLGPVPLAPSNNGGQSQPIPEPGTWAMWVAGIAVLAYLLRRRRR